jgi:hypothetical protein
MKNEKPDRVVREVEQYFGFLHNKGYVIRYADHSTELFGNWVVEYASTCCMIYITRDRGDVIVEVSSAGNHKPKDRISLEKIIYMVTGGKKVVFEPKGLFDRRQRKQLRRKAQLLEKYLTEITLYFAPDAK